MKTKFIISTLLFFSILFCTAWTPTEIDDDTQIKFVSENSISLNSPIENDSLDLMEKDLYGSSVTFISPPKTYTGGTFHLDIYYMCSKPDKSATITVTIDGTALRKIRSVGQTPPNQSGTTSVDFTEAEMKQYGLESKEFRVLGTIVTDRGTTSMGAAYVNKGQVPAPKVPPVITLNNKDSDYDGQDYVLTGQWKDEDSKSVDLFYTIDGGSPVKFSSPQNQPVNQWYDYSTTIKSGVMDPTKKHVIQVYAIDTETLKSNVETVTLSPKPVKKPPIILLNNKNGEYDGEDYKLTGSWIDEDSDWVDLYYQIDTNSPVKFGGQVPNDEVPNDFEYIIKKGLMDPNVDHKITVYAIDDTKLKSNIQSVTLTARKGELLLQSYPIDFSFGDNLKVPLKDTSFPVDYMNGDLIVSDTRSVGQTWSMTARVIKRLEGDAGSLGDALYFYKDGQEYQMKDGISVPVTQHETINESPVNISEKWDSVDNGFRLKIPGHTIKPGNYSGTIEWTLNDAPLNK